jgi:DNA-binding response OmpR family regulator
MFRGFAEDDPDAAFLFNRAWAKADIPNSLVHARDGEEAVKLLEDFAVAKTELALVILDIKMPKKDGFEVLTWMRSSPFFSDTPVVMLSCSTMEIDIERSNSLGANYYFIKPLTLGELVAILERVKKVWIK